MFTADLHLRGKIKLSTKLERGPAAVLGRIARSIRYAADECDVGMEQIQRIGIGLPAWVDAEEGLVRVAPALGWENVPVQSVLQGEFRVPLGVANVNDIGALAMHKVEVEQRDRSDAPAVVFVAPHISGAVIRDGHWGSLANVAWAHERFEAPHSNLFRSLVHPEFGRFRTRDFRKALRGRSQPVREYVLKMADVAGDLAAMFAEQFHPAHIALSGGILEELREEILDGARRRLSQASSLPRPPYLVASSLGNAAGMTGAAAWAAQDFQSLSAPSISAAVSSRSFTARLISSRSAVSNHS